MAYGTHLKALLKKNWILWKRSCCCSCLEMIIPTLFVLLLLAIRRLVGIEEIPQKSYLTNDLYDYSLSSFKNLTPPQSELHNDKVRMLDIVRPFVISDCKEKGSGILGLAPDNEITRNLEQYFKLLNMDSKFFNDNKAMSDYIESDAYGTDSKNPFICFGIALTASQPGNYKYSIRFNATKNDDIYDTSNINERTIPLKTEDWNASKCYLENGFIRLLTMVDNLILQKETNSDAAALNVKTTSLPVPAFIQDDLPTYLKGSTNIFLVLPMILIFLRVIYRILYEKERKIREGMKMMGMNSTSFYLSWIITYVIIFTIISIIETVLLSLSVFKKSNGFIVWVWIWLFLMCLLFQALFVSVFFTKVKSGLVAGFLFFFVLYIVNALVGTKEVPDETKLWASLSSHAGMTFSGDAFVVAEARQGGIQFDTIGLKLNGYAVSTSLGFFVLNIAFYFLLFIYLDQVFPNEFGRKKHPLFFLDCCLHRGKNKAQITPQNEENEDVRTDEKENIEEVDAGLQELEKQNQCISIKNLSKTYPNGKKAVTNLSLTMYNSQIFVLLGHNGAGKTTTTSMLTGMIDISSGKAMIGAYDVQREMESIRKSLGVCPQHDILFEELTVKELLELFATFKGMNSAAIPAAVDKIIQDLDFVEKEDYLAKKLSGGQKRKLSVGIAFIGGSKIILLDEPTSGMDTSARRHIWDILKTYKQDKIVILTTHFMDEADFLGDRIAVMSDGQLKCCGSSVFLKNKFGIGYNLIIVKADMSSNPQIPEFVKRHVPEARLLSEVSAEISFQLPLSSVHKFKALFDNLDNSLKHLQILSYGISITTLEEVFLKIAEGGDIGKEAPNYNKAESLRGQTNEIDNFDLNKVRLKSPVVIFFVHFWALILKKMHYYSRDKKGLFCEIFMPILMITVGLAIVLIQFVIDSPPLELLPTIYPTPLNTVYSGSSDTLAMKEMMDGMDPKIRLNYHQETFPQAWDTYLLNNRRSDQYGAYFIQEINKAAHNYTYISLFNTTSPDSSAIFINRMNLAVMKYATGNKDFQLSAVNDPLPLSKNYKQLENSVDGSIASVIFVIGLSFVPAILIVYIIKERENKVKHQQMVSGVSLLEYWFSNFFVDIFKYLIPAIYGALMCKAFNISAFTADDCWGVFSLLFILYGFAVIPFTYLTSFMFKDYGTGQLVTFFFNLIMGAIVNTIMWLLRLIPSSRSFAKQFHFFMRIIPSFSFGYGILNISNRELYALYEEYRYKKNAFDWDIASYDLLYMGIFCLIYMALIFLAEKLLTVPSLARVFTRENSIQYQQHPYDEDVLEEMKLMERQGDENEYTIKVKNLRKVFLLGRNSHKVGVDRLSFGIKNGECFGLLGINGAGKTTTFKMLCGETMPTSGEAYIKGYNLSSNIKEARNFIGYCPQFDALLDNLTGKEHLYLYAALKGIPSSMRKDLVEKKLDEMELRKYENVVAGTYSGGNKRKLSVAIAMLGNPPIVLLDEPSTGMDPHARRFMWDVISRISTLRKNSSIILTTHSMEEAEALATKIAIMVNGEFKCLGSIQHIKNKFGKGYEIEIKTVVPSPQELDSMLAHIGMPRGSRIGINAYKDLLARINMQHLEQHINPYGSGSSLFVELNKPLGLSAEIMAEYIIIQTQYGPGIMNFIKEKLGDFSIIEHFQNFYRFKLDTSVSIGSVFGTFEEGKNMLRISHYSVKQATIEQIFNMFATGQIKEPTEEEKSMMKTVKRNSVAEKRESSSERPTSKGRPEASDIERK